ncbi:hypothetical protein [Coleofasciculus sp. H7-2]|uniref:hypothetical protein n=1 Tax=Coleofasciculus sp. H7-2 TaxID=3351545 RepID=UPI00366F84CE
MNCPRSVSQCNLSASMRLIIAEVIGIADKIKRWNNRHIIIEQISATSFSL